MQYGVLFFLNAATHHRPHSTDSWRVWVSSQIKPQSPCGSSSGLAMSSPVALSAHANTQAYQKCEEATACVHFAPKNICKRVFVTVTPPEASRELSSRRRRSRGCGHVLSGPEPIRLTYVKRLPSGSQSLCSPGCPLRFPALLDDAWRKVWRCVRERESDFKEHWLWQMVRKKERSFTLGICSPRYSGGKGNFTVLRELTNMLKSSNISVLFYNMGEPHFMYSSIHFQEHKKMWAAPL